ncbi:MAG: hypothetical protein IJI45_01060 [Anaerolineaceae bacterium]|nr:hypothetical protein [Anaerolineaceae bacterium]
MILKLNNEDGFTLAETLMTVLIMLLVSSVIAAGIPAAAKAYRKAVDAANAQVLLSTAVNAIRSELSTAWGVAENNGEITYYSTKTGSKTGLFNDSANHTIKIQDYLNYGVQKDPSNDDSAPVAASNLVSDQARTNQYNQQYQLAFTLGETSVTDNTVTFADITVKDSSGGHVIASSGPLTIRLLKKDFKIPEIITGS